jgi:hypothetical protein
MLGMGFQVLMLAAITGNRSASSIAWVFGIYGFFHSALSAVCYGLLLAAILTGRSTETAVSGLSPDT